MGLMKILPFLRSIPFPAWIWAGCLVYLLGNYLRHAGIASDFYVGNALRTFGVGLLVYGISRWSVTKGQSYWWGLLGLTGIVGVIFAAFLPDKRSHLRIR